MDQNKGIIYTNLSSYIIGDYHISSQIYLGPLSCVYAATNPNNKNKKYAIKLVKSRINSQEHINNEIEINILIKCPYILSTDTIILKHLPEGYSSALIMRMAEGSDLIDYLCDKGPMNEFLASQVIHAVLKAVQYLNSQEICHRDIKPDNVFLMDKDEEKLDVVLGDLGHSCHYTQGQLLTDFFVGTTYYQAPELLQRKPCLF